MKSLVAFDLDGTLAESKQALKDDMGEALADLLAVAHVAVISGGDWAQFQKQVASREHVTNFQRAGRDQDAQPRRADPRVRAGASGRGGDPVVVRPGASVAAHARAAPARTGPGAG